MTLICGLVLSVMVIWVLLETGLDFIGGNAGGEPLTVNTNHFAEDMDDGSVESGKMSPQPAHKTSKGTCNSDSFVQKRENKNMNVNNTNQTKM